VSVASFFGLPLFTFCDPIQEREDPFRGYLLQILAPEFFKELSKNQLVRPN
jgi:hypothetical protein